MLQPLSFGLAPLFGMLITTHAVAFMLGYNHGRNIERKVPGIRPVITRGPSKP